MHLRGLTQHIALSLEINPLYALAHPDMRVFFFLLLRDFVLGCRDLSEIDFQAVNEMQTN